MKRQFTVKYRYGKTTLTADTEKRMFTFGNISAAMIRQIMEQINPEMRAVFGNYTWQICETRGGYAILARSGRNVFTESTGKTPQQAFWNCYQVRAILG